MVKSGDIINSSNSGGTLMYSFNGRFNHQLDAKNRIRIPAKFKADLGTDYKFAFGPNKSIYVMPFSEYRKILDSFGDVSYFDDEMQEAISDFTAMVYDVTEDNQGRVVIPGELKDFAEIDKDIVITGAASFVSSRSKTSRSGISTRTSRACLQNSKP